MHMTHVPASTYKVKHTLCAKKTSGNDSMLPCGFCPHPQIPAKLSGSSAIDFHRNLIGMNSYLVNSMFVLEESTA